MSAYPGNPYPDETAGFMSRAQAQQLWDQQGRELIHELQEDDFNRLRELADAVGVKIFIRIARAVCTARREHAVFGYGPADAMKQVKSEMLEWEAQAMLVERPHDCLDLERKKNADAEAYDVIATLIRWIKCEFDGPVSR